MHKPDEPSLPHHVIPGQLSRIPALPFTPSPFDFEVTPEDRDPAPPNAEEILERYEPYIREQVKRKAYKYSNLAHQDVRDLELDEIAERVLVNFWMKLQRGEAIEDYEAYIRQMVEHAFIDRSRSLKRRKEVSASLLTLDNDSTQKEMLAIWDEAMLDPRHPLKRYNPEADLIERGETEHRAANLAEAMKRKLSRAQRKAFACLLHERLEYPAQFATIFRRYGIDVEHAHWPDDGCEKGRLKSYIAISRLKIALFMGIDWSSYKQKKRRASRVS